MERDCCLRGFQLDAETLGTSTELAGRGCYVTGTSKDRAILIIHDLFGWTFRNTRALADLYAKEVQATVYIPDFFGGEVLPADIILDLDQWHQLDLPSFLERNRKEVRTPEILEVAQILRSKYQRFGAIGFCFGGWGVFTLAGKGKDLVDCISTAHPSGLTEELIQNVKVPVQIISPEFDFRYSEELKAFSNKTIPTLGVPYDYQYFPSVEHGFAIRGDTKNPAERRSMERAKNASIYWLREWLLDI